MNHTNPPDVIKAKRWEGKPLSFKIKYLYANYPGIAACLVITMAWPIVCAVRLINWKGGIYDVNTKYKSFYHVVRDDDPDLEKYIEERDRGSHNFPKY